MRQSIMYQDEMIGVILFFLTKTTTPKHTQYSIVKDIDSAVIARVELLD